MYADNVEILSGIWPDFREKIADRYAPSPEAEIRPAESGDPALLLRGLHLSSRRDPVRDADRIMGSRFTSPPDLAVFLHFGLGYELEAFWKRFPQTPVVLLEPDVPLFLTACTARDLCGLLSNPLLTLLLDTPPEALAALLSDRHHDRIEFFPLKAVARLHSDYLEKVEEWFRRFYSRREINRNTLKRFGRVWVRNLLQNLPVLSGARPVGELQGILAGRPCLVLAAGPTLDELAGRIHEIRQRMAVVAVDTAASWCGAHRIRPDFLVVVDPQYWNSRHLDALTEPQVLVSESSTHPSVFRRLKGLRYFSSSLFPLGSYLEGRLGIYGNLGAGGSVATTAWDFARFIGAGSIYCGGLDLGFPDMRTHYHGSLFEELSHLRSTRTCTAMSQQFRVVRDGSPVLAESADGGKVVSDRRLALYRWWFENRLKEPGTPPSYTLSTKGVRIDGMLTAEPESLLELSLLRGELDTILPKPQDEAPMIDAAPPEGSALRQGLDELDEILGDLEIICSEALKVCASGGDPVRAAARLQRIDARILAHPAKEIAGFLLDAEEKRSEDPIEASAQVYGSIRDSVLYHRELIRSKVSFE
jgi:6-hydroxymethylpterin diphosphokinase MptE-like